MLKLPPNGDALDQAFDAQLTLVVDGLAAWRLRALEPWKHKRCRTDEELEQDVDRTFTMYYELNAAAAADGGSPGVTSSGFLRFCRDARLLSNAFTFKVRAREHLRAHPVAHAKRSAVRRGVACARPDQPASRSTADMRNDGPLLQPGPTRRPPKPCFQRPAGCCREHVWPQRHRVARGAYIVCRSASVSGSPKSCCV